MRIINRTPFEVEALPGNGPGDQTVLTIVVKGTFEIRPDERPRLTPEQLPVAYGDELYDEEEGGSVKFEADIAPFKPRADIVLVGRAYAPEGNPVGELKVSLRVGEVSKTIQVVGERFWERNGRTYTRPEPFTVMDLVYERAFGGIDTGGMDKDGDNWCKENLVGRGFFARKTKTSPNGTPLPNLEAEEGRIQSWKDHPKPVGFGFYGRSWEPRASCLGTYDQKWRKERSPNPPVDFRYDYYNGAHPDLQVEGYLKGNEIVELIHLTPGGRIQFKLPGIFPSVTVSQSAADEADIDEDREVEGDEDVSGTRLEVPLHLDTLCIIPDEERFYLVWRGIYPVNDLTAIEVREVEVSLSNKENHYEIR